MKQAEALIFGEVGPQRGMADPRVLRAPIARRRRVTWQFIH
jgi:hypothetical protein